MLLEGGFDAKIDEFAISLLKNETFKRSKTYTAILVLCAILVATTMDTILDVFDAPPASLDTIEFIMGQMMVWLG